MSLPTLIAIPCLSGAPWHLSSLTALRAYPMETLCLSDEYSGIDAHVDDILSLTSSHERFVLMGDSFGALIALAAALRHPAGLVGLVMSGGFAAMPINGWLMRLKVEMTRFLPGLLYQRVVLPLHAKALASRFDGKGGSHWNEGKTLRMFRENTPWKSYVRRTQAALKADYRDRLAEVDVPTLILTPEDDTLIGEGAARILREGIPQAREVVLEGTGHLFRLSHPARYSEAVRAFLEERVAT